MEGKMMNPNSDGSGSMESQSDRLAEALAKSEHKPPTWEEEQARKADRDARAAALVESLIAAAKARGNRSLQEINSEIRYLAQEDRLAREIILNPDELDAAEARIFDKKKPADTTPKSKGPIIRTSKPVAAARVSRIMENEQKRDAHKDALAESLTRQAETSSAPVTKPEDTDGVELGQTGTLPF